MAEFTLVAEAGRSIGSRPGPPSTARGSDPGRCLRQRCGPHLGHRGRP